MASPAMAAKAVAFLALAGLSFGSGDAIEQKRSDVPDSFYVPPYYPAPYGGWVSDWADSYKRAKKIVDGMTLAEKTNITSGTGIFMGHCAGNSGSAPRIGFPQLCFSDGANGIRHADHVTVFPDGITAGATFDKVLMYQRGSAMGKEAHGKGANVLLGPTVGPIGRKPKGGRNWEGFGADPVLQAVGARETIRGVQEHGVIATIKHLVGNEQEMYRMYNPFQSAYSSNIDDRTLHEVYLWPFAEGVHEGVGSVMTAYNAVNGTACSQHPYLINGLLKDELGFQGFVQSDWLGHMSGVASAIAGLDMNMPGDQQVPLVGTSFWMYELTRATLNGSVPMDRLNDMTTRIVATWLKLGQDDGFPATNYDTNTGNRVGLLYPAAVPDSPLGVVNQFVEVQEDHDVIARQVAQEAITLLKNDDALLPLSTSRSLKVFGTDAQKASNPNGCLDRNCNKGTLGQGWGSGTVDYPYLDDPITNLRDRAAAVKFHNSDSYPLLGDKPGDDEIAIVFISSDAGENTYTVEGNHGDRDASGLYAWHGGDKLVQEVAKRYDNVVVVAHTVGPLVLDKWVDLPSVKSVLIAHMPGQEAGKSLTNVLFGDASPCGHLPYTITHQEDDMPASVTDLIDSAFLNQPQDTYSEGLFIDYRWLNKQGTKPRYAFGHGLSYTNFSYSDATIQRKTKLATYPPARSPKSGVLNYDQDIPNLKEALKPKGFRKVWRYLYSWLNKLEAELAAKAANSSKTYPYPDGYSTKQRDGPRAGGGQGGNPALWDTAYTLSVKVVNTGKTAGKASVQAYLQFPDGTGYDTPVIQLRDFEKTKELGPGESTTVELALTRKDVSVWDTAAQDWKVPAVDGAYKVWIGAASDDLTVVCRVNGLKCERAEGPVNK